MLMRETDQKREKITYKKKLQATFMLEERELKEKKKKNRNPQFESTFPLRNTEQTSQNGLK